jgi:hypothetical protein
MQVTPGTTSDASMQGGLRPAAGDERGAADVVVITSDAVKGSQRCNNRDQCLSVIIIASTIPDPTEIVSTMNNTRAPHRRMA